MGSDKDESWWIAVGKHALLFIRTFFYQHAKLAQLGGNVLRPYLKSQIKLKYALTFRKGIFNWLMAQNVIKSKINFKYDADEKVDSEL